VNNDYTRTMNKIIFDKFLEDNDTSSLFPEALHLPVSQTEVITNYYGMQQLNKLQKESYMSNYKEICYG
jgi:dynein heavy chain